MNNMGAICVWFFFLFVRIMNFTGDRAKIDLHRTPIHWLKNTLLKMGMWTALMHLCL